MDDVRVYNRELSPDEVKQLSEWAPGPVGWWKMDEKVSGNNQTLFDFSGNGNNGTITGAVLATFWGSNSDEAFPYDLTLGATLYQKDSDSTIMPICFNTSQVIAGFTRLGWFPAGSGILRGLTNTYTIPVDAALNVHIPAGDYTFAQIAALTPTDYLKRTDSSANNITLLKGRVKQ